MFVWNVAELVKAVVIGESEPIKMPARDSTAPKHTRARIRKMKNRFIIVKFSNQEFAQVNSQTVNVKLKPDLCGFPMLNRVNRPWNAQR